MVERPGEGLDLNDVLSGIFHFIPVIISLEFTDLHLGCLAGKYAEYIDTTHTSTSNQS